MDISFQWLWVRLRGVFTENLTLKLLSFAFAMVLYVFSHGSQDAQRTIAVDVVASPAPDSARRVLLTPLPPQVRVTIRGPRSTLDELRSEDLGSVQVDLRSGKTERVEFYPSMVHVPPSVHVEQIDPQSIELRWEDVITRDLPVQVSITGQPAPGFVVKGAPKLEPAAVKARGPRSVIEVLQYARATSFDATSLEKDDERMLGVDPPPPRVEYDVHTVQVRVEITREELERLFVKIPVQVVGVARATAVPAEVDVHVKCPPEIARSLRGDQIVPTVDLKAASVNVTAPGSAKLEATVQLDQCQAIVQPHLVVTRWQ